MKNSAMVLALACALALPCHATNIIRISAPIALAKSKPTDPPVEVPGDNTAHSIALSASPAEIPADGVSTSILTATVLDDHGQPVNAGRQVTWWTSMGDLSGSTSATDVNGVATMQIRSVAYPGAVIVTTLIDGIESSINLKFINNTGSNEGGDLPSDAILMNQSATQWAIPADGVSTTVLTVMLTDPYGVPVAAGLTVPWSTDKGTLSASASLTDENGHASVTLTAPSTSGVITVSANGKWPFRIQTW